MNKALTDALLNRPGVGEGRDRDHELVCCVGRHGAVSVEDVMRATGVGRTMAYRRIARCAEAGLLERLAVLHCEPALIRATREGLRYAGLPFPVAEISPGSVTHWLRCAATAHALCEHFGAERVLTEREIAYAERMEGRPLASAEIGTLRNGERQLHRPDLAALTGNEVLAVEVELTPKSPARLAKIMSAWRAARWVSNVSYVSPPGQTRRAVKRAVKTARADNKVVVLEKVPW